MIVAVRTKVIKATKELPTRIKALSRCGSFVMGVEGAYKTSKEMHLTCVTRLIERQLVGRAKSATYNISTAEHYSLDGYVHIVEFENG